MVAWHRDHSGGSLYPHEAEIHESVDLLGGLVVVEVIEFRVLN